MATKEASWHAPPASTSGPPPGGAPGHVARAAGPFSGRSGRGVALLGGRTQAAVEKRGPYLVMRVPSIQAKLRECGRMGCVPGRAPESRWGGPGEAPAARCRP